MPFITREDTTFNADGSLKFKGTGKICGIFASQQYAGQEYLPESHADIQFMFLAQKISQIRAMRNRKLDEIDIKYCNAQKWEAMTALEKQSWSEIKAKLIAITDKNADGSYVSLTSLTVDGYLDPTQNVWPW